MSRPLSAEERQLWRRVTADVRPVIARPDDDVLPTVTNKAPVVPQRATPIQSAPAPSARARMAPRARPLFDSTLDASWDRKLRQGQIEPDRVVDLHGHTLDAAHRRALDAVAAADRAGDRVVVLITGRPPPPGANRADLPLRGIIRASIADWLAASPVAGRISAVRVAHRRHGGTGAIYIVLRRGKPSIA